VSTEASRTIARSPRTRPTHFQLSTLDLRPLLLLPLLLLSAPALARGPFENNLLSVPGRVNDVVVEDLTGDGLNDLLVVHVVGLPPREKRRISLFLGPEQGPPSRKPDQTIPVAELTAAFDVADIDGKPGKELLLLDRRGLSVVPLTDGRLGEARRIFEAPTLAGGPEKGNLPRAAFSVPINGEDSEPALVLPDLGGVLYLAPGSFHAGADKPDPQRLELELRYSYRSDFTSSAGPRGQVLTVRATVPGISVGDHDGDGNNDLFVLWSDEADVFERDASGRFKPERVAHYEFDVRTKEEKKLRNAGVVTQVTDLNADGVSDLLLSKTSGGFMDMKSWLYVYPGLRGGGYGSKPSQTIKREGFTPVTVCTDLDGDEQDDLILASVEIGIFSLSQMLLKSSLTVNFDLFVIREGALPKNPTTTVEIPFRISFQRGADVQGAVPIFGRDFNGDGRPDLLHGRGVDALEIHLGDRDEDELFQDHFRVRLKAPTSPWMRVGGGDKPGVVVYYRNIPKLDGKIFWFRNTNPW